MSVWAVLVAAGSGSRFGGPKQFADLAGRPVLEWSIEAAIQVCDGVVAVVPPGQTLDGVRGVAGGATRSESVRNGLAAVPVDADVIVVHDAARPLARAELWAAVIKEVTDGADAAIPGAPVTDTVKEMAADGSLRTLDRSRLVAVQTPQAFKAQALRAAHAGGRDATDDAALVEASGGRVVVVPGPRDNIKITAPEDLPLAAAVLESRTR